MTANFVVYLVYFECYTVVVRWICIVVVLLFSDVTVVGFILLHFCYCCYCYCCNCFWIVKFGYASWVDPK